MTLLEEATDGDIHISAFYDEKGNVVMIETRHEGGRRITVSKELLIAMGLGHILWHLRIGNCELQWWGHHTDASLVYYELVRNHDQALLTS